MKLSVLSESGKEIAIDVIQPGEIFGEFALNLGLISVGRAPIGVVVSGSNVWVTNSGGNTVTRR